MLLGAAAQGDWCTAVGQAVGDGQESLTSNLAKRLARIQSLIPRIVGLPIQAGDGKGRHKAWLMLTKVAMHALDYDAKLIPSPVMERMTSDMQQMLDQATDAILGCNLDDDQRRLVQQPGCFGGLGARRLSRSTRADAAYWATWDLHAQVLPMLAAELGRPVGHVADEELAQQARQRLEQAGVCAKCNAILKFSDEVTRVYTACPWNQEKPCDGIWLTARRGMTDR